MEFVLLLVVLMNHNSGESFVRVVATPNHQVCEEASRELRNQIGPLSEGFELRTRCVSTELLAPSV